MRKKSKHGNRYCVKRLQNEDKFLTNCKDVFMEEKNKKYVHHIPTSKKAVDIK